MGNSQVTIKDLAKILGVAPSTVSRALKNHPDISNETKKQVVKLAEQLAYQPNPIAISLRGQKTLTIGVIIPEFVHHFFSTVISGIEGVALEAGYNVLVCCSNGSYDREVDVTRLLLGRRVDGLLLCVTKNAASSHHLEDAQERGVPVVLFDNAVEGVAMDKVIIDDYHSARKAVMHLLEQGCRNVAYIGGSNSLLINQQRLQGYESALKEYSIPINSRLIKHMEQGDVNDGINSAKHLLQEKVPIDGLFSTADLPAIGAIKCFKESGLRVPEDIAVVGFSDWQIAQIFEPSLSTISQPGKEMGSCAMKLLLERMNGLNGGPQTKVLNTELLVRASSKRK